MESNNSEITELSNENIDEKVYTNDQGSEVSISTEKPFNGKISENKSSSIIEIRNDVIIFPDKYLAEREGLDNSVDSVLEELGLVGD